MKKIYNYIRYNLYAENSANKLLNMVEEFTEKLIYNPKIYAEVFCYRGINQIYRRIVIKNYVLLYTVDEKNKKVFISHMYYSKKNYLK